MSLKLCDINEIVKDIKYLDWEFFIGEFRDPDVFQTEPVGYYLQIRFKAIDTETGLLGTQNCRKWYVSRYSATAEVIRTAYKAVQAAVEHEADENFTYKGHAIYNPHLDPNALMTVAHAEVYREPNQL